MGLFFLRVIKFKKVILTIIFIFTALSLLELKNIKIDTSMDGLAAKESPEKILHTNAVNEFGGEKMATIFIQDPELFSKEKLAQLQELSWKLLEIPELVSIYSVFTTPYIYNDGEILHTSPLFEELPESPEEIQKKLQNISEDNSYRKFIISPENNSMLITVQFDTLQRSLEEVSEQVDNLMKPYLSNYKTIYQVGTPALMSFTKDNIIKSFIIILPAIILVISSLIFHGTRSMNAALLPFIVASISLIWTFAFMSLINIPIQILTSCVPAIAFVLGSTEITHLLSKYKQFLNRGFDHRESITLMGDKIGLAIILTAVTTTLGFLTITVNEIEMLRQFGLICAVALASNFILMIFYLPIHLDLFKDKKTKVKRNIILESIRNRFLETFEFLITKKYLFVVILLVATSSLYFSKKIKIENISWSQIKESSYLKKNLYRVNDIFPGTNVMYFIVEAKNGNFKDSKNLTYLSTIQNKISQFNQVHHTQSLADNIELIHREFNKDSIILEKVPKDSAMISQYLLSFSRDNLAPFVSANYKRALIQMRHTNYDTPNYNKLVGSLDNFIENEVNKDEFHAYYTSSDKILNKATNSLIISQINSLSIIILIIIAAVTFLFRDIRIALIAVPSNLIPIIMLFGLMGAFGIPLTTGSAMVAAITIGIAVDDTIHFFVQYSNNLTRDSDPIIVAKKTIEDSSMAIVTTSIALATGFCLLAISDFIPLFQFGLLSSFVIILAMFCDLIITPTLITIFQLSNVVSYDNIFLTQIPIKEILNQHPFKGMNVKSLKDLVRQIGITHLKKDHTFDIKKNNFYLILIKGQISQLTTAKRSNDNDEHLVLNEFSEGQVTTLNQNSQVFYRAKENSKYILVSEDFLKKHILNE